MPRFADFFSDADAGMLLPITAVDAQQAVAKALVHHPGAKATAAPAELLDGQDRHELLWVWLRGEG